jgi:chemotaxis protein MotA
MHVLAGIASTILAFLLAQFAHKFLPFFGLLNPAALCLLVLGPVSVSLISNPFSEWASHLKVLRRAFRHRRGADLARASDELSRIARAVRESRWDEADRLVAESKSEQVRALVPYLVQRLEPDALEQALGSAAYRWMSEVRNADEFFQGLGRLSPAFGMIGTIMGLVDLFSKMRDSASLGPGMAMALLATLYGLILCYCVYMPLAMRIRAYLAAGTGEQRVIERAIHLIVGGRPIHEVRGAFADGGSVERQNGLVTAEPRS